MAIQDLTPLELLQTAYSKGVPANKVARLVSSGEGQQISGILQNNEELAAALLELTLQPQCPALILSYLKTLISLPGVGDAYAIALLLAIRDTSKCQTRLLIPLAQALVSSSWYTSLSPLPATIEPSPPSVGTSDSANTSPVSTLSLAMPLIRLCTPGEGQVQSGGILPIQNLTARILSVIPPYPTPNVELGLEVSVMMPNLPQVVAGPLRGVLSGLMADLASGNTALPGVASTGNAVVDGTSDSKLESSSFLTAAHANSHLEADTKDAAESRPAPPSLPSPFSGPAPIPMPHAISFFLGYASREARYARQVEQGLWSSHLDIIRVSRALRVSSSTFVLSLVEGAINAVLDRHGVINKEFEEALVFLMEHLPDMLKWWKRNGREEWPFPNDISECIKTAIETSRSGLQTAWTQLQKEYQKRVAAAEMEDDSGHYPPVEEAGIASYAETFLRKLVQVNVLTPEEAKSIWPEANITPFEMFSTSLLDELLEGSKASLPVKELAILTGPAAQRTFATSVLSTPQTPLPDTLLPILSSSPALLACLTTIIPPRALLEVLVDRLLNAPIDESARADDPQGVLTRFGEGVVLIEAVVYEFELDLPEMLKSSRRSRGTSHLSKEHRASLSGWITALFGSEGIDDQVILQTAPRDLIWLSTVIIQQAIFALGAGQLDLDALHSGLSYFAQPLLSWCLGGIVSWLCSEIVRNSAIAAIHLEVLQTLISGDSFPEALLRMNDKAIMCFMEPTKGLAEVMEKAEFDAPAVRARLQAIGLGNFPDALPINSHHPLNVFRSNLQVIRHLEVSPPTWPPSFLADCVAAVARSSPGSATSIMFADILRPSMEYDQHNGDPLAVFTFILLSIPLDGREPHIKVALDAALPNILGKNMNANDQVLIASIMKGMMVLFAELRAGEVESVWEGLMDKLGLLVSKDVWEKGRKRKRQGMRDGMDELIRSNAEAIRAMLAADEEMSSRWGKL